MTETNARKVFGRNLTDLLYEKRITQKDLGKYMGVSSATTSDWCSGKKMPRIDKLISIAHYLHVEMSDLVDERPAVEENRQQDYYTDEVTAKIAEGAATNRKLRALFSMQCDMNPDEIDAFYNLALTMHQKAERLDQDDPC